MRYVYVVMERTPVRLSPFVPSSVHLSKYSAEARRAFLIEEGTMPWRIKIVKTEYYP